MKQQILSGALALCLLLCVVLSGCSCDKAERYVAYSFDYFDTATTVIGYADSKEAFDKVADRILSELKEYHQLYTIYHRFDGLENLCTVNELVDGAHRTVTVDRRIIDLLLYAKEMYTLTNGRVNIAMGSVLSLWHEHRTVGMDNPAVATLPSLSELQEASAHTDIEKMIIDEEKSTVTLLDEKMTLDVGAIAKGYATERVARMLEAEGIEGYVLNVGGNVRTIGTKPDGEWWTVGLEDPTNTEEQIAHLSLSGQSLVTSGSYQRYYVVNGERYHHIIHPDTLMPATGYLSVSVICEDSGLADALSTALFCMPLNEGLALIESIPNAEALWVEESGEQTVSSGWDVYVKE